MTLEEDKKMKPQKEEGIEKVIWVNKVELRTVLLKISKEMESWLVLSVPLLTYPLKIAISKLLATMELTVTREL
jgi:hypothetical protein